MSVSAGRPVQTPSFSRHCARGGLVRGSRPPHCWKGLLRLREAGIEVAVKARGGGCRLAAQLRLGRPRVTLKLVCRSTADRTSSGESKWITGEDARAHVHLERANSDMILVGRGTYLADWPKLDVRLPGLEERSPRRALLTGGEAVEVGKPLDLRRISFDFMTSTTCSSKAAQPPPPRSSPPILSIAS